MSFPAFTWQASAAVDASGYRLRAKNLQAAVSQELADYSLGQRNLETYDVGECSALCDSMPGCKAFNLCKPSPIPGRDVTTQSLQPELHTDRIEFQIDFQRSPTLDPGDGEEACPNPPSMTNIFCSLYSTEIKASDLTWEGERRGQFDVVITGQSLSSIAC